MTTYAVTNPATGETTATYDTFTDAQIADAVARADAAASVWAAKPAAERAERDPSYRPVAPRAGA